MIKSIGGVGLVVFVYIYGRIHVHSASDRLYVVIALGPMRALQIELYTIDHGIFTIRGSMIISVHCPLLTIIRGDVPGPGPYRQTTENKKWYSHKS